MKRLADYSSVSIRTRTYQGHGSYDVQRHTNRTSGAIGSNLAQALKAVDPTLFETLAFAAVVLEYELPIREPMDTEDHAIVEARQKFIAAAKDFFDAQVERDSAYAEIGDNEIQDDDLIF